MRLNSKYQNPNSKILGFGVLFLLFFSLTYADAPIYGYFWLRYIYENPTTPDVVENEHEFAIERGYVRWKTKTEPVSFSGTIDITNKAKATNASDWNFRLKYAQADWTLPYISKTIPDAKLMIGLQKVYFGMMDIWEYPLIEKNLEEVEKKTSSADLGLGLYGLISNGFGEFALQVFNGNGYSNVTENNANKAVCGNLALIPIPGIMLKGSLWQAKTPQLIDSVLTQVDQNRYAGLLQFKYGPATVIGEVLMAKDHTTDGLGYSGFVEFAVNKKLSVLGRYDMFDKNRNEENDAHTRMIGGINYAIADNLLTQLNYQIKIYEDPAQDAEDVIMLQFKYSY
ncbi:MAG: hypothetical protein ABIL22_06240 [candidate division WOR-3 bacterium]